jgi:hypothetical protein
VEVMQSNTFEYIMYRPLIVPVTWVILDQR